MGNLLDCCRWSVLALVFLSGAVWAETIPATATVQGLRWMAYIEAGAATKVYTSVAGACANNALSHPTWSAPTVSGDSCVYATGGPWPNYTVPVSWVNSCSQNGTAHSTTACTYYSCPANQNWTMSGSGASTVCTRPDCAVGFDRNSLGVCVKDCTGKLGQSPPSPSYEFTNDGGSPSVGGCLVKCGTWTRAGGGTTLIPSQMLASNCTYTGASDQSDNQTDGVGFTPKPAEPKTPNDCLGAGMGYVSGSTGTTCVAQEKAPEGQKPAAVDEGKTKESGTPGTDGKVDPNAQDYKKTDTETKTEGGKTTTKKTETVNSTPGVEGGESTCPSGYTKSTDGLKCTKVTVTTEPTSDFCKDNPQAAACKNQKDSSFNGTCEAGFTCEGDAAQCASAKASWELRCVFQGGSGGLLDEANPGGTAGQIDAGEAALNRDGSSDFNIAGAYTDKSQAWVDYSSNCPVGVQTFQIGGKTLEIDGTIICDIGKFVRLLVHIVAYMGLARLFATKLV